MSLSKSTILTLVLILVEFSRSMLSSAMNIPSLDLQKTLSERLYKGDKSLLMTRVDIASSAITFLVSVPLILLNGKKNVLKYKTRLMLLPAFGCFMSLVSLTYLTNHQHTVSAAGVYVLLLLPSLTGELFLFETCLSDIAASAVTCKQHRVSIFLWMKGAKIIGVCVVQILLPIVGVDENTMLRSVSPATCAMVIVSSILLVFVESCYSAAVAVDDNDFALNEKVNDDDNDDEIKIYDETTIKLKPSPVSSPPSILKTLRGFTVYHGLLCALITLHSAQRGEYKFTYVFLSTHLHNTEARLRIINGCQYLLFSVSLYSMGFVVKTSKSANITLNAFVVSMVFSACARVCQIVAWELTRFDVWILSAVLSTPGPLAYQVVQQVMYKKLADERLAGVVLLTADKFMSIPVTQLYQVAYRDWLVCPFYVTLTLMVLGTIVGLSTKTMRAWIRG
ncbi:hypothetical protein AgipMNPV_gp024 [Agrotis ipsilon multiple nucleopolyhedrovirus]|uniref:Uncharacterized protein n=1 Tax=Agrotis ipsilon multiple nucleopolyhedrovirus TaxID=208013 RepID=B6D5T8_9ABAC|nr:hypothetical protein AgipMNPV_gp024 [Agrotis ipsilon multiple nucleopolyhedrovirus]ACI28726.1 unknown [Agrotis ipsilon multiple nucleopolyhedrovirus]